MAKTILARRTWDQGKESLWAAACSASASRRAIVNLSGRRPRIRAASHAVRADRQHRTPVEFIARVVSGDTSARNGWMAHTSAAPTRYEPDAPANECPW